MFPALTLPFSAVSPHFLQTRPSSSRTVDVMLTNFSSHGFFQPVGAVMTIFLSTGRVAVQPLSKLTLPAKHLHLTVPLQPVRHFVKHSALLWIVARVIQTNFTQRSADCFCLFASVLPPPSLGLIRQMSDLSACWGLLCLLEALYPLSSPAQFRPP